MNQFTNLNVKLSNSQLDKLQPKIKSGTESTLNLSSNVVGYSNVETNFQHRSLLLSNTQVPRLCKSFENNLSANRKLSKTQLHKPRQLQYMTLT